MSLRPLLGLQSHPKPEALGRGPLHSEEVGFVDMLGSPRASRAERSSRQANDADPDEQTLVVCFEPLSTGTGQVLLAAQVVGLRLLDLVRGLPSPVPAAVPSGAPSLVGSKILVEIESPAEGQMRATIKLDSGSLGPITLELDFSRGHLELRATVCTSRAAQTLVAAEVALREGLAHAGLDLRGMQVWLAPKREVAHPRRQRSNTCEER